MWKWVALVSALLLSSAGHCANYEAASLKADKMSKAGDSLGAAAVLEAAIGRDSGEQAEWLRGTILRWKGASEKDRVAQLTRFTDSFPGSVHASAALLSAGYLTERVGGDPKPQWERLAREYPRTADAARALHRLGRMALRDGDPVRAGQLFDQSASVAEATPSVEVDSILQAAYAFISQYWKTGNHQILREAISRFSDAKSQTTDPAKITSARMGLGEVYLIEGLNDKAAVEYQAVLDSEVSEPYTRSTAQFELGCAQFGKKDYTGAVASLDLFLSGCAGSTPAQKDAAWKAARPGYTVLLSKNPEQAAKLCGLDLVPQSMCVKAHALIQLGRSAEAAPICSQILTDFPKAACADRAKQLLTLCEALEAK